MPNSSQLKTGNVLSDGWILGGVSTLTNQVFSREPPECALRGNRSWHQGNRHAKMLHVEGNLNARMPTDSEWGVIRVYIIKTDLNNRAKIVTNKDGYPLYWSSPPINDVVANAWDLDNYSAEIFRLEEIRGYVRCIRDEPQIQLEGW